KSNWTSIPGRLEIPYPRGAQEGTRTPTALRPADFKSAASTIPPPGQGLWKGSGLTASPSESIPRKIPRQKTEHGHPHIQPPISIPDRHRPPGLTFPPLSSFSLQ